ncbi:hypothetical protein K440DRAFT_405397 [Wilcoxina mikolae CBS 423.85]|nr:hypothetical protein K440DRAFT_405397 [Wilcoxina mikolae CBS 423.85]
MKSNEGEELLETSSASQTTPEKAPPFTETLDDAWIDNWDMKVYRCAYCNRPFVTYDRLLDHLRAWHSDDSPKIAPYEGPSINPRAHPGSIVVIAQGGDMFLETPCSPESPWATYMNGMVQYQVASQVLWIASPVFRKMFGPESNLKEAAELRRSQIFGTPTVISLDDDPQALEIILMALHHQNDLLPQVIEMKEMVHIAEICDKYEFHQALKPIADKLFLPMKDDAIKPGNEDSLLCCYVFGYEDVFAEVSKELILRGAWNPGQGLHFELSEAGTLSSSIPGFVVERLTRVRKSHVESLRKTIRGLYKEPNSQEEGLRRLCTGGNHREECEALQLGHWIQSAAKYNLDDDEMWNQSLRSISSQLKEIKDLQCSWARRLHEAVDNELDSVEGLKLSDFPSAK